MTASFPHLKCIVLLRDVWLKQGFFFLKAIPISLFTRFISPPFSHLYRLSDVLVVGLMKGDNGSWVERYWLRFSLVALPCVLSARWNLKCPLPLSFLYLISSYHIDSALRISLSLLLHLSLHISLFAPNVPPTHPRHLSCLFAFFLFLLSPSQIPVQW